MLKFSLFIVLFLSYFLQPSEADFSETIYTLSLAPNQVVDSPVIHDNRNSYGTGYCKLDRYLEKPDLLCVLQHNLQEIVEISINAAPRGVNGMAIYYFTLRQGMHVEQNFIMDHFVEYENETIYYEDGTQVINSTVTLNYTISEQINDFLDGMWYIQIVTLDFPQGEVRGQIEHRDRFYSPLSSQNTIPRSSGSQAHGISVGTFASSNKQQLSLSVVHDVTLATSTDIFAGEEGEAGNYLASASPNSPSFPIFTLTVAESLYLYEDLLYLSIASQSNPLGDIRGQLITIDYISNPAFTAILNGAAANTASLAVGNAIFSYDCSTRSLEYLVMHTLENATSAFMNIGLEGTVDSLGFILPSGKSPIFGSRILSESEANTLITGLYFVSIYTTEDTTGSGEIRGQVVNTGYQYFAYLSGTNVLPPVSTKDVGIMLIRVLDAATGLIEYQLIHSSSNASLISLYFGSKFDNNGQQLINLPSAQSPTAFNLTLSSKIITEIQQGNVYAILYTPEYETFGALRGQFQSLKTCEQQISIASYPYNYALQESQEDVFDSTENVIYVYLNNSVTLSFSNSLFFICFMVLLLVV